MSLVVDRPEPALPPELEMSPYPIMKFSVQRYHEWIATGALTENDPVELLEGWLVPKMPKSSRHDGTVQRINRRLGKILPVAIWEVRVQSAITLADSEPEPDLAVVRMSPTEHLDRHPGPSDIGMLVEVSDSSLLLDRHEKARMYARANIPVYWVVNLPDAAIEVYGNPGANAYATRQDCRGDELVPIRLGGIDCGTVAARLLLPA